MPIVHQSTQKKRFRPSKHENPNLSQSTEELYSLQYILATQCAPNTGLFHQRMNLYFGKWLITSTSQFYSMEFDGSLLPRFGALLFWRNIVYSYANFQGKTEHKVFHGQKQCQNSICHAGISSCSTRNHMPARSQLLQSIWLTDKRRYLFCPWILLELYVVDSHLDRKGKFSSFPQPSTMTWT